MGYPTEIQKLLDIFGKLPGVGPKTAERFTFWLLRQPNDLIKEFADAILSTSAKNKICSVCLNLSLETPCVICKDQKRDHSTICVVEDTADLLAIESSREYNGVYHVLGGVIVPLDNITPEKLGVAHLLSRIKKQNIKEIILALNPTIEGETTSLYLAKNLRAAGTPKISTLGRGLPFGADLEYADSLTLSHALSGRRELTKT